MLLPPQSQPLPPPPEPAPDEPAVEATQDVDYTEVTDDPTDHTQDGASAHTQFPYDGGQREALEQDQREAEQEPVPLTTGIAARPKLTIGTKQEALPDKAAEAAKALQEAGLAEPSSEENPATTALTTLPQDFQQVGLQEAKDPRTLLQFGTLLYQSNVFPTVKSPQDAVARILMARSLGIDEIKAMYMLHTIDGKLVLSADLTRYLLDRAKVRYKLLHDHEWLTNPATGQPDYLTRIRMKQDSSGKDVTYDVWWQELQVFWTGRNKGTWEKFPRQMHTHAGMRQCARFYFPAILGGFYEADELGAEDGTFAQQMN